MAWTINVTQKARKQFLKLPKTTQEQIAPAIDDMASDPFRGDVVRLQNKKWRGHYRKRVGSYRIIFLPLYDSNTIEIREIRRRNESTYR